MFRHDIIIKFNFRLTGFVDAEAIFNFSGRFLLLRNMKWVGASV